MVARLCVFDGRIRAFYTFSAGWSAARSFANYEATLIRMRVLHLSSLYPPRSFGGAERVVSVLAEAQARAGHEVGAAFLVPSPEPAGALNGVVTLPLPGRNPLWIEESGRYPSPVRLLNKICTVLNVRTAAQFGRVLDGFRPDVVHTHSLVELPPMVWEEVRHRGIALVHTLHDYDLLCVRAALFRHGKVCERRHLGCAAVSRWKARYAPAIDDVVAVSRPVLDRHLAEGVLTHLPRERLHVVGNPVVLPRDRLPIRWPRASQADPFRFGFLGRLVAEKGIGLLIEACRRLPQEGWRLRVGGLSPQGLDALREQARGLPVTFEGFVDAPAFLAETDVLVVPSIWSEPFGLTVIEAYGAGVPVLGAEAGAIGDLVRAAAGDGWVVPANDPDALAARMLAAMRDELPAPPPGRVAALLDDVDPDRVGARYLDIYRSVLARRDGVARAPLAA